MKISTYFFLFFALFLCNFAKAQDTIPTPPTPSPEVQKILDRVPEIKKAIDKFLYSLFIKDDVSLTKISINTSNKVIDNAFEKK